MDTRTIARILGKIDTSGGLDACHEWTAVRSPFGHGITTVDGRQTPAHRAVWTIHHGPIPSGKVIRHLCNNPPCCNIRHLAIGTQADNAHDRSMAKYRHTAKDWAAALEARDFSEMFEMRRGGMTYKQIAERYGVSYGAVRSALSGESWKNLGVAIPLDIPERNILQRIAADAIETARRMRDEEHRPWREIEDATGYSRKYLQEHLPRRTGYNPNPAVLSPAEADEAVRLRREGMSWTRLSRHFENRISRMGLYLAWRDKMAWWRGAEERVGSGDAPARTAAGGHGQGRFSDAYVRGTSHYNAKLDADKIEMIRALRLGGWSWARIAEHVGVDRSTATRAGTGRGWAHLGPAPDLPKMVKGRRGRT